MVETGNFFQGANMIENEIIDAEHEAKFREWFRARGGVLRWANAEIASSHPMHMYSPALTEQGSSYPSPNWRYTSSEPVDPNTLQIEHAIVLKEWDGKTVAKYWGLDLTDASKAKAERVAKSLSAEFRWSAEYGGKAKIEVYQSMVVPFSMEVPDGSPASVPE